MKIVIKPITFDETKYEELGDFSNGSSGFIDFREDISSIESDKSTRDTGHQ